MSESSSWDLAGCVERLRAFRDARDWARFHNPKDLAAAIAIEAGELQELFLWKDALSTETQLEDPEHRKRVEAELADVLIFALYLADSVGIDLPSAIQSKVDSNESRYDRRSHRGVAVKAAERGSDSQE